MGKSTVIRTGRHCVFNLHVHLVFTTKYRYCVLQDYMMGTLQRVLDKVCQDFEAELVECNGEADHIHLLVNYPPTVALSRLVNSLKGVSSRRLKQYHPEVSNRYYRSALWSPSYFAASCGGAPIDTIKAYISNQRRYPSPP